MCLGVPGQIVEVETSDPLRMGRVSFEGVQKQICLVYVPEVGVGDWVIVHAGFAIHAIDAAEADRTLTLLKQLEHPE
ncbi:MAG: HypC/HybG/HupF family hydrogenase formation chaperone [Deltaproteobacteria bacterium]|nr:MAG: HypC/HybG/HupF family hydrogenase formation chaperone [Deltaproteobacteria bacterium]